MTFPDNFNNNHGWPPGTIMAYDNREQCLKHNLPDEVHHVGLGIVVANDGFSKIWVIWDATCRNCFSEYDVRHLNRLVISRRE